MRVCVALGLIVLAVALPTLAQNKNDKEKAAPVQQSGVILSNLQIEISTKALQEDTVRFKQVLELLTEHLRARNREVVFLVDEEAFRDENRDLQDIYEAEIRFRNPPAKATIMHVLRLALKQLPAKTAMLVRAGQVEIVPIERTSKEYLLNHTFYVDFKDRPLDAALEELSDLTGVSIVMDARGKQKAQTPVTARFRDDVALQDAVRMLTDMAELKIVYMVTGLYITTPEHAQAMQKELKQIYGVPDPSGPAGAPAQGGLGQLGGGMGGMIGAGAPLDPFMEGNPLAPPLPPRLKKRLEGA